MTTPTEMTDAQLLMTIRQCESSPSAHRTASIAEAAREYLRELYDEADRRGLEARALRSVRRLSRGTVY